MNAPAKRRALFLDRDGTLIADVGYPKDSKDVRLIAECIPVLREAIARGFALVIITNQSGVGRGFFDEATARLVQARAEELFAAEGIRFDGVYYCFHGPDDDCACRKPKPALLLEAARDLDLDLMRSLMIGDKPSDLEAGRAAGCEALHASWPDVLAWLERAGFSP